MAKGDFFIKLYIDDWLNDMCLRGLKRENRDSWLTACLLMSREGTFKLEGPKDVVADQLDLTLAELDGLIEDLKRTNAADVMVMKRRGNAFVMLKSRRYERESNAREKNSARQAKFREKNRLRVTKHRERGSITPLSQKSHSALSISYKLQDKKDGSDEPSKKPTVVEEISKTENRKPDPEPAIQIVKIVTGITAAMKVKQLPNKTGWINAAEWAIGNGFSSDQFLECYSLMKQQKWRSGAIKPTTVVDNLPDLARLRMDISRQSANGPNGQNYGITGSPPKNCEICQKHDGLLPIQNPDGTRARLKCKHDPKQLEGLTVLDR